MSLCLYFRRVEEINQEYIVGYMRNEDGFQDATWDTYLGLKSLTITCWGFKDVFPELPTHLEELYIYTQNHTILPPLPATLKRLNCAGNRLRQLPPLPVGLTQLDCPNNCLTSLPELPPGLMRLTCSINFCLTTLPPLPPTLVRLSCGETQISVIPPLPETLEQLDFYVNLVKEWPILPHSLKHIDAHANQLKTMPSSLPPDLVTFWSDAPVPDDYQLPVTLESLNNYAPIDKICDQHERRLKDLGLESTNRWPSVEHMKLTLHAHNIWKYRLDGQEYQEAVKELGPSNFSHGHCQSD